MKASDFLQADDAATPPVSASSFLDSPDIDTAAIRQQQNIAAASQQAAELQGETFESYLQKNPTPSTIEAQKLLTLAKTPEQKQQVANYIRDTKSPELEALGVIGQIGQAITTGPIPQGEHLLQANPSSTPGKVALGVERAGEDVGNFFLSPLGIATLGIGALPRATQRVIALGFAAQMASQVPGDTIQLLQEVNKPADQRDWTKISQLLTSDAANTIFAGLGAAHGFAPKTDFISKALAGELDKAKPNLPAYPSAEPAPITQPAEPRQAPPGITAEDYLSAPENAAPPSEQAKPAPEATQKIQLKPALLVNGEPVTGGDTHADISKSVLSSDATKATKIATATAFLDDSTHVFVDQNWKVYNRQEAAKAFDESEGNPPGTTKSLHSEMLQGEEPVTEPTQIDVPKVVESVKTMSPDEFISWTKQEKGGLTGAAYRLGQSVSTPEELQSLQDMQAHFVTLANDARAKKDFASGFDAASRKQFYREAYEAATGTGSAGDSLRKSDPDYKPPFPEGKTEPLQHGDEVQAELPSGETVEGTIVGADKNGDAILMKNNGEQVVLPEKLEVPNAIPERSTKAVPVGETPGGSGKVVEGVPAPEKPAAAPSKKAPPLQPEIEARPLPTSEEAFDQNVPFGAWGAIQEYDSIQKILKSGRNANGTKLTKKHRQELIDRIPQVVVNYNREVARKPHPDIVAEAAEVIPVGSRIEFENPDMKTGGEVLTGPNAHGMINVKGDNGKKISVYYRDQAIKSVQKPINKGALGNVGMGGAKPAEFQASNQTPTGIKNATVETERMRRGLPPAIEPLKRSFGDVWTQAMADIDRDPGIQDRLIDELREKPRPVTDLEDALLLHRQVDLQNDYAKATRELAQAYDDSTQFPNRLDDVQEWKSRVAGISDKLFELYEINKRVGTENSRGLNARKMMANEDFSLAQMELAKRAANGGRPLTDEERAEVQKLHDRIKQLEDQYNALVEQGKQKDSEKEVTKALDEVEKTAEPEVEPHVKSIAQRIVDVLNNQADEARKRIAARSGRLRTGIDPTELADYAIIGASHIGKGIVKFSEWSKAMLDEFGDAVKPHLKQIFDASNKTVDDTVTRATSPQTAPKVKRVLKKAPLVERQKQAQDTIKERLSQGKKNEISGTVRQLARLFVEAGIKDRDKLIDAVHGVLKESDPTITRREAMDAISGYGDFKQLTKDQVSVQLRDLKGQMQQVAKLEDITSKKPPLKSGVERRTPSDEERRLIKEVNEAKRRFGVVVTDPATQLRSAIQARKTYYENQIKDLDSQIQQKQPFQRQRTPPPTDAALQALIDRRNELKRQYDELFPKSPMTDEQRIAVALRSTDRQIEELERQLKTAEIFTPGKTAKPTSPELEAKRARLEELKQERQWARDTIQPPPDKDPERASLEALKKRMQAKIDDLNERIANGDFSPPRKPEPVKLDDHALRIKADYERAKAQFERALIEDRLKNRSPLEKLADTVVKWRRGFILSSPVTLGKLVAAALERMAFTPTEEAIGGVISKAVPEVARQAKREGGFSAQAEAKAIQQALTKGAVDAWDILRTGQSELDALYGGGREGYVRESMTLPRSFIDVFGHIHGFLKAPTKRAEFARSLEKRTAAAIRDGVDVSDPMVQTKLAVESYKDANRAIFLQDNRLVTAYKMFLAGLEQKNKETGKPTVGGKIGATAARIALPIVRVPANLVAETFQYAFGSLTGSARLARALAAGTENLKPGEADLILRELKKGSLGAALLLIGYFNANNIGGYYQQGQKRKEGDVKIGGIRVAGHEIPAFLLHNPLLETLQLGATIRRVEESKLRVHDKDTRGLMSGLMAGLLGLADEVPFVREMFGEIPKMFNSNEQDSFWGELGKSLLIPQLLQWLATYTDKDDKGETVPRQPRTVLQHIETGLPFLRRNVPMRNQRRKSVLSE